MFSYYIIETLESLTGTEDFTAFGSFDTFNDARDHVINDLKGVEGDLSIYTIFKQEGKVETRVKSFMYVGKVLVAEVVR
jgi:hypothetical protein